MIELGAESPNRGTTYLARYCFMDAEIRLIETKRNLDERNIPGLRTAQEYVP